MNCLTVISMPSQVTLSSGQYSVHFYKTQTIVWSLAASSIYTTISTFSFLILSIGKYVPMLKLILMCFRAKAIKTFQQYVYIYCLYFYLCSFMWVCLCISTYVSSWPHFSPQCWWSWQWLGSFPAKPSSRNLPLCLQLDPEWQCIPSLAHHSPMKK